MGRRKREIILTEDKMKLVEQYIPYAEKIARKINKYDDNTLSQAYWSLIYLADRYNENSGCSFGTFIKNYLYKHIKTQLYRADYIDWKSDLIISIYDKKKDYEYTFEETIPSNYYVTLDDICNEETYKRLTSILTKRQRQIFDLYISGLTMQEIGNILGRTRQAISLIWRQSLDVIHNNYSYKDFA